MATIWSRINTIILLLVLFALLAVLAMLARDARSGPLDPPAAPGSTDSVRLPGTPISGPTTITQSGHYYLTRNIAVTGGQTAITISASSVTLDLGGFAVVGTDDNAQEALGVHIAGGNLNNIVIRNGIVRDHLIGINADLATYVTIEDVQSYSNVVGIDLGASSVVRDSVIGSNSASGLVINGNDNYVHDNFAANNNVGGVTGAADILVQGSTNVLTRNVTPFDVSLYTAGVIRVSGNSNFMDENYTEVLEFAPGTGLNEFHRGRLCAVTYNGTHLDNHAPQNYFTDYVVIDGRDEIRPERSYCPIFFS